MGAAVKLTPLYGRSPQGERVYGAKPTAPGKRIRTLGALGLTGLKTALCFEGTLTGAVFLQFLDQFLMPLLQPGQIVILDNAKAHGGAGVRERMEGAGARLLYLPPYSPDLNPIEMAWSKVKQCLRKAQARTIETLYEAISQALQTLSPKDAKGFFQHVGFCI
jgi:transposase